MTFLGKPQIKIEEDGTDGEKVTVKCHVYGYPASNIEWSVSDKNGTYKLIDELDVVSGMQTIIEHLIC